MNRSRIEGRALKYKVRRSKRVARTVMRRVGALVAASVVAGCTSIAPPAPYPIAQPPASPGAMEPQRLMADLNAGLAGLGPDASVTSDGLASDRCGPQGQPVVRMVLNERVLFDTDSDQPRIDGGPVLDQLAAVVKRDAPIGDVTVVGHTDAVGSDAYNMDLSRRRADKVLRALVDRGLDPSRISAVAIGKRQPIADDSTALGRARNRRVEFLISRCLAANLGVVQRQGGIGPPADVLRPDAGFGVRTVGAVTLGAVAAEAPSTIRPPEPVRPLQTVQPPPVAIQPQPRYQPRALSPQVQPNALGPAVPF